MSLTGPEATEELLKRETARESLQAFVEYHRPDYVISEHQKKLCEALEAVERGDTRRLIVTMPPGHSKSEYVSRYFPPWVFGRNPRFQLIHASYNLELAEEFGYDVKHIIDGDEFKGIFDTRLAIDRKGISAFRTTDGGRYRASGIGGSITGRRGNGFIIDDPLKGRKEADSQLVRDDQWRFYDSTVSTRLWPTAWIILVLTPWHEDDIRGRLLERMARGLEHWDQLEMPLLIETKEQAEVDPLGRKVGEVLWPDQYNVGWAHKTKREREPREWQALYQCRPSPESGHFFKRDWFEGYESIHRSCRKYLTSDWAVSDSEQADYTVHQVWAYDQRDNLYLIDMFREQVELDVGLDAAFELIAKHKPMAWINEKGQIRKSVGPFARKLMRTKGVHVHMVDYARTVDKIAFARPIQARMSGGFVFFDTNASWYGDLQKEWLKFNAGQHDDTIDAAALIGHHLEHIRPEQRKAVYQGQGAGFSALG